MSKGKMVAVCVWGLVSLVAVAATYKLWWVPRGERIAAEQVAQEKFDKETQEQVVLDSTSSNSQYKHIIPVSHDWFTGYDILRSSENVAYNRRSEIKLTFNDDGADGVQRLKDLASGKTQVGVFTIGSLIKSCAEGGYAPEDIPVSIVAFIDETRGADMAVAYKKTFPNIDAINHPETKLVLIGNSPSETFARILLTNFKFSQLPKDPFIFVDSPKALFDHYRKSSPEDRYVYITWQPWGTKILDNPNAHTLIDSSRFKGYIVDVIVVNRDYLYKNPDVVQTIVENYYRSVFDTKDTRVELAIKDAAASGEPLSQTQAEALVDGVWWKNTQEAYGHFGLGNQTLQHVEDMITNLTRVLIKSGSIKSDPTGGRPNLLYFDGVMKKMHAANFHPGFAPEAVRNETRTLGPLDESQWGKLIPVGTLDVPILVFRRGSYSLTDTSKVHLDGLVKTLNTFPSYYCLVNGDASTKGDLDANQALALGRANAAKDYLVSQGIDKDRISAVAGMPSGQTAVRFQFGEAPY